MSAIRHDRSVIEARGGIWPWIADQVRDEAASIATAIKNERDHRVQTVRDRLKALDIRQGDLGVMVGMSASAISNLLNGYYAGSEDVWARLDKALTAAEASRAAEQVAADG